MRSDEEVEWRCYSGSRKSVRNGVGLIRFLASKKGGRHQDEGQHPREVRVLAELLAPELDAEKEAGTGRNAAELERVKSRGSTSNGLIPL